MHFMYVKRPLKPVHNAQKMINVGNFKEITHRAKDLSIILLLQCYRNART